MPTTSEALSPSLHAMLTNVAAQYPDKPAIVHLSDPADSSPQQITFAELLDAIEAISAGLVAAGVTPDQSVAILSPTIPEAMIGFVAAASCATAFPLNALLTPEAMANQMQLANTQCCIVYGENGTMPVRDKLLAVLQLPQPVKVVIEIDSSEAASVDFPPNIKRLSWQQLMANEQRWQPKQPNADRVAALFHTGGTSGSPKLAELGESALAAGPQLASVGMAIQPDDRTLSFLPHFHVGGTLCMGLGTMAAGGTLVTCGLLGGRNPQLIKQLWQVCETHQITIPSMVPTSWSAVMESAEGDIPDRIRGLTTGGAAAPEELVQRVEKRFQRPMSQIFGMTEMAGFCTAQPVDGVFRSHSVGFAPPGITLHLEPMGSELNEVWLKGPNMFLGYRTAEGRIDTPTEWLRGGDLGEFDELGQLQLLGRSKDVIIRSGHNIDPVIIEDVAYHYPGIVHALAIGYPDDYAGEVPVLFVIPAEDANLDGLHDYLVENIVERPALPKKIMVIDELPMTPVGKIERYRLRQRCAEHCAQQQLADLSIDNIRCDDPLARCVTLTWSINASEEQRQQAKQRLAPYNMTTLDQ